MTGRTSILRSGRLLLVALLCFWLGACGSMFPTVQAERAADKILDDIMQTRGRDAGLARSGAARS